MVFDFFLNFFHFYLSRRTQELLKTNFPIKLHHWGYKKYHIRPKGTFLGSENAHIQPLKLSDKWIFLLFSQFVQTFSIQWTQKPVEANLSNIKYHWEHRECHI